MNFRLIALCMAALVLVNSSYSQKSSVIFKAGLNLANVSVTNNGKVDDAKMLTSFHFGITGDLELGGPVYFQPGLFFTGKGTKSQSGDPSSYPYFKATSNPKYIEVPLNLVLKAPIPGEGKFFVGAGPYVAIGILGKNKTEGKNILGGSFSSEEDIRFSNDDPSTLDYEEGAGFGILKRFDYGLNGTAGFEGKSIMIAVNYGLGLAKLQSGSNSSSDNNNKHRVLSFSLGFKL